MGDQGDQLFAAVPRAELVRAEGCSGYLPCRFHFPFCGPSFALPPLHAGLQGFPSVGVRAWLGQLCRSSMATRIYVGNLPLDIRERELEDLFYKVRKRQEQMCLTATALQLKACNVHILLVACAWPVTYGGNPCIVV